MIGEPIELKKALPKGMLKPPLRKEDLEDKRIEVIDMNILEGEFGDFARISIRLGGELRTFVTGASIILERLNAAREQFPVMCKVVKSGRSWLVE